MARGKAQALRGRTWLFFGAASTGRQDLSACTCTTPHLPPMPPSATTTYYPPCSSAVTLHLLPFLPTLLHTSLTKAAGHLLTLPTALLAHLPPFTPLPACLRIACMSLSTLTFLFYCTLYLYKRFSFVASGLTPARACCSLSFLSGSLSLSAVGLDVRASGLAAGHAACLYPYAQTASFRYPILLPSRPL